MSHSNTDRRAFLKTSGASLAGASLLGMGLLSASGVFSASEQVAGDLTIQEVIDKIISQIPGGKTEQTVDLIKQGDASARCTGIVTTFMATAEVIKKTADLGANFIITHEPTFYGHLDNTDWLENDPVYQFKKKLIADNGIVVWRFHDYWHRHRPDGILEGFLETVGWKQYQKEGVVCEVPEATVKDVALHMKKSLGLKRPFIVGDASMKCSKVALLPGAWGGTNQINFFSKNDVELMIVGEVAEWETSEYVRDASFAGMKKALIILGHQVSEEPGMKYLVGWMNQRFPDIKTTHVSAEDAFQAV